MRSLCGVMSYPYWKVAVLVIADCNQRGINLRKRLLCQTATGWWSTDCHPCLHIITCSTAKVDLTLLLPLIQIDALLSQDHTPHRHTHVYPHSHAPIIHNLCMLEQKNSTLSIYCVSEWGKLFHSTMAVVNQMQSWFTSYSSLYSSVTSHQEQVCSFIDASALLDFFSLSSLLLLFPHFLSPSFP